MASFFESIQGSGLGRAISESLWLFPIIETIHVFALTIVAGTVLIVDLRLLGVASMNQKVSEVTDSMLKWTWGAFVLAAISGTLLFVSRAADYMALSYFIGKFVVMALAGLNMLVFHFVSYKTVDQWDSGPPAGSAKMAGAISLICWMLVIILARRTGFSI